MKICGVEKMSLVDWKGKIAVVLFLGGCNFRCGYCHNKDLVHFPGKFKAVELDDVMDYINENKDFLTGIVVTGGEPTVSPDLFDLLEKLKTTSLPIKLDTNGSNPHVLKYLIDNKLIDFVAMDVKAPLDRYEEICGCEVDIWAIENSIAVIKNSGIEHEFRTTMLPELSPEDIEWIKTYIGEELTLQEYRKAEQ